MLTSLYLDDTQTPATPEVPENTSDVQPEQKESAQPVEQQPEPPKEKSERIQRERDEALMRLKQMEEQRAEPELNLGPDDLAEGKHISKMQKKMDDMRRGFQQELQEIKLRSQYPDADKILSPENLELLKQQEPEIAAAIGASPDFYSKAVGAYKAIKRMGIYQDPTVFESEREVVQKNAAKPRAVASLSPQQGDSPLSHANAFANGLTPELKAHLVREMADSQKFR
jgi:hypothetical protein